MTDQEKLQYTFDYVVDQLMEQGEQATNNFGGCVYFSPDGKMCAIGCLLIAPRDAPDLTVSYIPDRDFRPEFGVRCETHRNLLIALQRAHDTVSPEKWPWALSEIALARGLDPGILVTWL